MTDCRSMREELPKPGDRLFHKFGQDVPVFVEVCPPDFLITMWLCATVDPECKGWFLCEGRKGLKVLITPESQKQLREENRDAKNDLIGLFVGELEVVKHTDKGTALIAKVVGYGEDS